MNHFPIYVKTADKRVCIIGNGDNAVAKARLVGKSEAVIEIYADAPDAALKDFIKAASDSLIHQSRNFTADDIDDGARLPIAFAYLTDIDHRVMAELSDAHIPYCVIDNLAASRFTTPALIDRAPLTIAIGTEGRVIAVGALVSDQYRHARQSGCDGVLITKAQAAKMPESHWLQQAQRVETTFSTRIYA